MTRSAYLKQQVAQLSVADPCSSLVAPTAHTLRILERVLSACELLREPGVRLSVDGMVEVYWSGASLACLVHEHGVTMIEPLDVQGHHVTVEQLHAHALQQLPTKRAAFRQRLQLTLELLQAREQLNPEHDSEFSESDFPTPLFIMNVAMHCHPFNPLALDKRRREGRSLDDLMLECDQYSAEY